MCIGNADIFVVCHNTIRNFQDKAHGLFFGTALKVKGSVSEPDFTEDMRWLIL